eukprot:scaffold38216_cov23-Phaeocystis_antarctica.AAC.1
MLSSLLSGIHRAVPYCDAPGELLLGQLHALFRCAHSTNLATTVQALMVLGHAAQFDSATSDRFYRTLTKVDEHDPNPNLNPHQAIVRVATVSIGHPAPGPAHVGQAGACLGSGSGLGSGLGTGLRSGLG